MAIAAAMGVAVAAGGPLGAQQPGARMLQEQQMVRLQEQAMRMNEAIQRMSRIQERAHNLEHRLIQEMSRLWQYQGVQEGVDVPLQLQTHERLRVMAHAMSEGAYHTNQAMEQLRNMLGEPGVAWDAQSEGEFERLRLNWEETAGQMEEGLAIMERLRDRISQPGSGS